MKHSIIRHVSSRMMYVDYAAMAWSNTRLWRIPRCAELQSNAVWSSWLLVAGETLVIHATAGHLETLC